MSELYEVNPATGAGTYVSTVPTVVEGLAFAPDGTLFATTDEGGDLSAQTLVTIDPLTGFYTIIGPIGCCSDVDGIVFTPDGSVLYGIDDSGSGGARLLTIDPATGLGTIVGPTGMPFIDAITIEPSPCSCGGFSTTPFGEPMGKSKKLGSTLPIKFRLFFDGAEVQSQGQLDTLLQSNGCAPSCPELLLFDVTDEANVIGLQLPDDLGNAGGGGDLGACFRFSEGNWVFNLKLDEDVFSAGHSYLVEVQLSDCTLSPGNAVFQLK